MSTRLSIYVVCRLGRKGREQAAWALTIGAWRLDSLQAVHEALTGRRGIQRAFERLTWVSHD